MFSSSEQWGSGDRAYGKYPVKIYTIDGVLIYQVDNGGDNTDKTPLGGVIYQNSIASSMLDAIANPVALYGRSSGAVINQDGHSGDLYNYYWTSYSRGTDGRLNGSTNEPNWHNDYLDGYIPLRAKSIYDPCPYLYRIPSNGTWNQFNMQSGWTSWSYLGGSWIHNTLGESWFSGLGRRSQLLSIFENTGNYGFYFSSITFNQSKVYVFTFLSDQRIWSNNSDYVHSWGFSVRCIEDDKLVSLSVLQRSHPGML